MSVVHRTCLLALLALVGWTLVGASTALAAGRPVEHDTSSVLVLQGEARAQSREQSARDRAARTRPARARSLTLQRPRRRSVFQAARSMVAFAVRFGGEQERMVRVARASRPAGGDRPWYRAGVRRSITYVSRPSGDLQLDVWYPRGRSTPAPTVVLVHGGGWRASGREEWDRVGWTRQLVHRGYVVVTPSYRMACRADGLADETRRRTDERLCGYSIDQSITDVRRSLGWVRREIGAHGGDADQVVVVGASAGGHLALMAAADRPAFVRGVAAISPATDLTWFGARPKSSLYRAARQAVGCPLRHCRARWQGASPTTLAARSRSWPSTYLFDAARDHVTPAEQNEAILRAFAERGVAVTHRTPVRPGRGCHGTYSCSQWMVDRTGRSLLDDLDAWMLARVR